LKERSAVSRLRQDYGRCASPKRIQRCSDFLRWYTSASRASKRLSFCWGQAEGRGVAGVDYTSRFKSGRGIACCIQRSSVEAVYVSPSPKLLPKKDWFLVRELSAIFSHIDVTMSHRYQRGCARPSIRSKKSQEKAFKAVLLWPVRI
jgi:hypothetical protein